MEILKKNFKEEVKLSNMFCFQCEQTACGKGCTNSGACGKKPEVALKQDELTCALIDLSLSYEGKETDSESDRLLLEGLFTTITNVNFDAESIDKLIKKIRFKENEVQKIENGFKVQELWTGNEDIVSLRSTLLFGMRGMAAYAYHAWNLGKKDDKVIAWVYKGLREISREHTAEEWLALLMEFGEINLRCMEILDEANISAYGSPSPVKVSNTIKKGPFIVVTGHDLYDLRMLLEQTQGKGVDVYTHGEMLPAHGYPELRKYKNLKGNFGTAWQNQKKEFDNIPAPVIFTTNCLMPPSASYSDRVFTTEVVNYPGIKHIDSDENGKKDFTEVINKALELGGYKDDREMPGINGGHELMTGFGHDAILSSSDKIIDSIKKGHIRHIFLVGGCDGAKTQRSYYTDFVKSTPKDTLVLTLACGKYRFNDLDLGEIDGIPRLLDVGQCNDAYSAIKVAVTLAGAFNCTVNDLPLTMVLSWYEQKAVCILLTLLSLGIKNIYIGPSIPAFFSTNVLNTLVKTFSIKPISTPEKDLKDTLG